MTVRRLPALLALLLALVALPRAAPAEQLVTAISTDLVSISSNFNGSQIVFFGSIERDAQSVSRPAQYEIAVAVFGPPTNVVARRKVRTFGLWINRESEAFEQVPSFYALLTTSPLDDIVREPIRQRRGLGFRAIVDESEADDRIRPPRFEAAFLRLMQAQGRYSEVPGAVEFLSPTLFRANLVLPPNVPLGTFDVRVFLFRDGVQLSQASEKLTIAKVGFEQAMTTFSREHGLLYGLATVLMATLTGWLASVIFRRD